jgi:D-threo-aldose 1-dehydrogenase
MEYIPLANTARNTTRLGFGCSVLQDKDLALLDAAFDAGIRHFDVARAYGHGLTEAYLGKFLKKHGSENTVATKYGILAPTRNPLFGSARRVLRPIVRRLRRIPAMNRRIDQSIGAMYGKANFTAADAKLSLEKSLRELKLDRVDIFLMHEADVGDLGDEGLLQFLEVAVKQGKIGSFGVGGSAARVSSLHSERPEFCDVMQFDWSILNERMELGDSFRIHYRTFSEVAPALHAALVRNPETCRRWSDEVGIDLSDQQTLASLMLKAALVLFPDGMVLFSSRNPAHISANVRVAEDSRLAEHSLRLYEMVRREAVALLRS